MSVFTQRGAGRSRALLALAVALIVASLFSLLPGQAPAADAAGAKTVKQYYFFGPPKDGTSVRTLASTADFVTLSKGQETYRQQLRDAGFNGTALVYVLSMQVEGPGPYANSSAWCNSRFKPMQNNVANGVGDFCRYIHPHEDWFLHNSRGARLYDYSNGSVYYHMNPASAAWRQFAIPRMQSRARDLGYDGLMLDNVSLSTYKVANQAVNSDGVIREYRDDASYRNAFVGFLANLSSGLRPGKQVWGNMIADPNSGTSWDAYLQYMDGGLYESFATGYNNLSADEWQRQQIQITSALSRGKGVLMVAQGNRYDNARQQYALGSYLLVTDNARAHFRYSNYYSYSQWWQYSNYNVQLGAPFGASYERSSGVWQRDFACGSVVVDTNDKRAQINQTTCRAQSEAPAPAPAPAPAASQVALSGVTDGATVAGVINVEATVADGVSVDKVTFYIDGGWVGVEAHAPYWLGGDANGRPNGFDTHQWSNGAHVLKAVMTDTSGGKQATEISITVRN